MAYEDRRWRCDVGGRILKCGLCAHYLGFAKCKAFPDGIPRQLLASENHESPYPGDHGYRFAPKEE